MLKEYRKRRNLSQEDLENITGLDRKTIFRIENNINIPLLDTFAKLVVALELTDNEIANEVKKAIKVEENNAKYLNGSNND